MINLAGQKDADIKIQEELVLAGIPIVKVKDVRSEVPYTLVGKIGNWNFERAWYYWMVSVEDRGKCLSLEVAAKMHETAYPIPGEIRPKIYGDVIRVAGHCGCPHPREWAFPSREVMESESKRTGIDLMNTPYGKLAKLFNSGKLRGERFVDNYHVDSQLGLNELARVLKLQVA
ncbi:MAG: hypothetical protein WCK90_04375 [archaeon]